MADEYSERMKRALDSIIQAKFLDPSISLDKAFAGVDKRIRSEPPYTQETSPNEFVASRDIPGMGQESVNIETGDEWFAPSVGPKAGQNFPYPGGTREGVPPEWYQSLTEFDGPPQELMNKMGLDVGMPTIDTLDVGMPTIDILDVGEPYDIIREMRPIFDFSEIAIPKNMRITPREYSRILNAGLEDEQESEKPPGIPFTGQLDTNVLP